MSEFHLVFDAAGGITLQTDDYCHYFWGREAEAAACVRLLLAPGSATADWDGNEPEHRLEYDFDLERRGAYKWVDRADLVIAEAALDAEARASWIEGLSGAAERAFFASFFADPPSRASPGRA